MDAKSEYHLSLKIERYLDEEMTASERERFEREIEQNTDLAEEIELQKTIRFGLKQFPNSTYSLLRQVEEERAQQQGPATKKIILRWTRSWSLIAAAAAAIVLLCMYLFLPNGKKLSDQELITYYQIDPFASSKGAILPLDLNQSLKQAYETRQASHGLQLIQEASKDSLINSAYLDYLSGFFHLIQNDQMKAIDRFQRVVDDTSSTNLYFDLAYQQLGLSYIHFHDRSKAIQVFQAMLTDDRIKGYQRKEIQEILEQIQE